MSVAGMREIMLIACFLVLSIPVHEFGHYIVAKMDGVHIYEFNCFISHNGTHFIGPGVIINPLDFSSPETHILCYLAGFLITLVPGLIISVVLYVNGSRYWYYVSTWAVSAPLTSMNDFDLILELLCLSDIAKFVHFGLGVYMVIALLFVRRKKEELINGSKD